MPPGLVLEHMSHDHIPVGGNGAIFEVGTDASATSRCSGAPFEGQLVSDPPEDVPLSFRGRGRAAGDWEPLAVPGLVAVGAVQI